LGRIVLKSIPQARRAWFKQILLRTYEVLRDYMIVIFRYYLRTYDLRTYEVLRHNVGSINETVAHCKYGQDNRVL